MNTALEKVEPASVRHGGRLGSGSALAGTTTDVAATANRPGPGSHQFKAPPHRLRLLRRGLVPVAIVGIWLAVTLTRMVDPIFVPGPIDMWAALVGMMPRLPSALMSSVTMTLAGFFAGTSIGLVMGLAMAYSRILRELFGGVLDFLRPVPVFALIPLFVLWFGLGRAPQILLIILGTSLILGLTTIDAIKNVAAVYIRAALVLGADRWTIYRRVILPSITPHLLGAIRVAAAACWGLDVAAEYIGAQTGLGHLMIIRAQYLDTAAIVDIVLIYSMLALTLDFLIRLIERPLTRWTERGIRRGVVASIVGST
jgi:ABC-type nitrate/sulfonate/bicarbonate transport system permease component